MLDQGNLMVGEGPASRRLLECWPVNRGNSVLIPLILSFKVVPHVATKGRLPERSLIVAMDGAGREFKLTEIMSKSWGTGRGTGMIKHVLACQNISVKIRLGEKRQIFVRNVNILVPFDVFNGKRENIGAKIVLYFVCDIPVSR
jgi:hypothetical protein